MGLSNLKVAIVHDDFIQRGGAERLVLAMLEIFPQADLFAVIASPQWQWQIMKLRARSLRTSWLQKLLFQKKLSRYYYTFYPLAVESWRFDDYDLVISSSARYAHGLLTKPQTVHVSYVNSPARFLWQKGLVPTNPLSQPILNWHRAWDRVAGQRPDFLVANSQTASERIGRYWDRKTDTIIYPFVDGERFLVRDGRGRDQVTEDYFLVVSRLNRWKQIEIAIQACNQLKLPLRVVGRGDDEGRLRRLAGPTVEFFPQVSDTDLVAFYQNCRALIQTQEEDFGITALEAQAAGRPVIAYGRGGARETILGGVTGVYFDQPTRESLSAVLGQFDERNYLRENCEKQAQRFNKDSFQTNLRDFVSHALQSR